MKKVVGPCCAVLVLICVCGYLFTRRASAHPAGPRKPVAVFPSIPPEPASGDLAKVLDACGKPKDDVTQPDMTRVFAGKKVRTLEYGDGDVSRQNWVSLRFDRPAAGWRFRGASRASAVNENDLSYEQLKEKLPCAAAALDYVPVTPPANAS